MDMERDDQVIYFKDLIFAALYRWRQLLAVGLALGVVMGLLCGLSGLGDGVDYLQMPSTGENPQEQALAAAETALERQQEYNRESLLMNLDPNHVYTATLDLAVDADYRIQPGMTYQDPDISETILYGYQAQFGTEEVMGKAAQAVDTQTRYLQELLKVEIVPTARSLRLMVSCPDQETAEKVLQTLTDCLPDVQAQVEQALGKHKVILLAGNVAQKVEKEFAEKQKFAAERTDLLEKELAAAEAANASITGSMSVKKAVILVALAVIGGMGVVACVAWVKHIVGGKVYSRRTLVNHTGVQVIAQIGADRKNGIDCLLRKMEGRQAGQWEDQTAVVAAYLRNCPAQTGPVLLTGDCAGQQIEKLAQALQSAGLTVVAGESLLRDPQTVNALKDCASVVLVEQTGVSAYQNVEQQIQLLRQMNKPLIGCVLLDI